MATRTDNGWPEDMCDLDAADKAAEETARTKQSGQSGRDESREDQSE